jgi:sugar lactone lactonase YvrE
MRKATTVHERLVRLLLGSLALFVAQVSFAQAQEYSFTTLSGARLGDGGAATNAHVGYPTGVVVGGGNTIYVAEYYRNRIRAIGADGIIRTVAGTGVTGFGGDGGPAASAMLNSPQALAMDSTGALYVADANNNRVRKVGSDGVISTIAGTGSAISSGDGGNALNAGINHPYGLAFDAAGNLYVSEMFAHRVRRIASDGTITTVAGNGVAGFSGDTGAATSAQLYEPASLGFDSFGNLYIADSRNDRVRKVAPDGLISTVAYVSFSFPYGLAVSAAGDLYIADTNCSLLKLPKDGAMYAIAGGDGTCTYNGDGVATDATVDIMEGLALAPNGDLYVSDSGNYRLRRISGGMISTVAGVGSAVEGDSATATFSILLGISVDASGNAYVADAYPNSRIRRITPAGMTSTIAGVGYMTWTGDGGPAATAGLSYPTDTAVDTAGRIYIADRVNNRVRRIGTDGIITTVAGNGTASGYSGDGMLATQTKLNRPRSVAVAGDGTLYIADQNNHRVRRVGTDGIITTFAGTGTAGFSGDGGLATSAALSGPQSVAVDSAGNVYIADYGNARIRKVSPDGIIVTYAGTGTVGTGGLGGPATSAQLDRPTGIAVDGNGRLFIAGGSLRVVRGDGTIQLVNGTGYPAYDVAVGADGSLYIAVIGGRVLRGVPQGGILDPKAPRAPAPVLSPLGNRK